MVKFVFFVPESHLETVKSAVFAAGAGRQGQYDCCAWQVKGQGQFRPLAGSQPFIGQVGHVEVVDEYRVEMLCPLDAVDSVQNALRLAHPYEEPAFEFIPLLVPRNALES